MHVRPLHGGAHRRRRLGLHEPLAGDALGGAPVLHRLLLARRGRRGDGVPHQRLDRGEKQDGVVHEPVERGGAAAAGAALAAGRQRIRAAHHRALELGVQSRGRAGGARGVAQRIRARGVRHGEGAGGARAAGGVPPAVRGGERPRKMAVVRERRPRRARDARRAGGGGGDERRHASAPQGLGRECDVRAEAKRGQQRVVSPHDVDTSRCANSAVPLQSAPVDAVNVRRTSGTRG